MLVTHFLRDILRQPRELKEVVDYLSGGGRFALDAAVEAVRRARHVYLTGIGSSWHAALNAKSLFHRGGFPVHTQDAAELLHWDTLPENSVLMIISRTGRSAEIVDLLPKARQAGGTVIGISNSADSPLVQQAQFPIVIPVGLDHGVSVNTYSTLSLAASILAAVSMGTFDSRLAGTITSALAETAEALPGWQEQVSTAAWLKPGATYYFLARSTSLGNCFEARLLWEEAVKAPATAMGVGSFRHGPQEVIAPDGRFGVWIDGLHMRQQDLTLVRDLRQLGVSVMLVGQDLPVDAADLVFQLPRIPPEWQFLVDILPAQLAAERLAGIAGVDCDSFRLCPHVVDDEGGLFHSQEVQPENA
jgi:glutamine---fructose-6-phosphate transaminase (isomerizing)